MRIQTTIAMVLLLAMSGQLSAQTRPATTLPTDPVILTRYKSATQYAARLKLWPGYHRLADLVELKLEKGVIQIRPKISTGNTQIRVELDDVPGMSRFGVNKGEGGMSCQFVTVCPSAAGFTTLCISGSSVTASISIQEITISTVNNMTFEQNATMMGGRPGVYFNVGGLDRGTALPQKNYRGSDLEDMRRRNPGAEDELRSFLSRVGQEHLLAADPQVAWQVFGGEVEPTPQAVQQVATLVKQLDADDFLERDEAVAKLRALGAPAMLAMVRIDRKGLSLEQQFRLDSTLEPYRPLSEQAAKASRDDTRFLMDCLICEEAQIRPLALARLKQIAGREIKFDVDAPLAERIQGLAEVRQALKSTTTRPAN